MPDKEKAKEELKKLIEKYHRQKSEIANEEQVCQSLILPLFSKVLGWDTEDPSEFKSQYSQRGIAVSTAYDYLSRGIQFGIIDVDAVVSKEVQRQIKAALKDAEERVKAIKERLPEEISYGEIMCVLANQATLLRIS